MEDNTSNSNLVRPIQTSNNKLPIMVGVGIVVVLVGLGVGYLVAGRKTTTNSPIKSSSITASATEAGLKDVSSIKDITTATGTLKTGGIKGEGTYHLDRPGGATQTVYMTSTTVDMAPFVDKKVQVWGQTLTSKNAPWFMDIVKIKVVE